ncbi:5-hydroxytryptamine receptor [Schistosoma japonicum]|uniref:5-hydroxytryptamine receptor n=1 Tax=Schistosoma japonicum TaxID=6182 RepID=A0A4Z2DI97_SCHJA|nr:5-hydroxytryptamine receptor [Schistosoma japonicum]
MNSTTENNFTLKHSYFEFHARFGLERLWITIIVLCLLILCTIIGNVFVVAAILLEKHLQGVSNYLIASLAVADLMVATLPMPVAAIYEISEDWWLGEALCDFWVCSDVLCCTASILHLVGIALDRYWAVTNAEYIRRRTGRRIGIMIGIFWFLSVLISIPARFYTTRSYNYSGYSSNLNIKEPPDCRINQEHGYTIFSNIGAFYMPMIFIIGIYARIYQVARARIRRSAFKQSVSTSLCMSQRNQSYQRQPNKQQQQQQQTHSFKQYLTTIWCCHCQNTKDKDSIKLTYSKNNPQSDTNTNQENPSSSHVVDTDCTMIGRNTTTHTIIPMKTSEMLISKKSNAYFDIHRKFIPYADDVENKSIYYQSPVNLTENNCNTKIIALHNCGEQNHIISGYNTNIDNTGCLYKHENRKLSHKEVKMSNSFDGYDCIRDLDFQEQTLLSRYRSSAPPILVHLNNSNETIITSNLMPIQQTQVNRERLEAKRERKAILTLAIITGCFLLCWLPFFIVALTSPFTKNFTISKFGQSMILWLGYSNSLLNPIIYTIFSPDFRNAFRKILFGRYNLRSLSR